MTTYTPQNCSNCQNQADPANMLQVVNRGVAIAHICDTCQQARKISVILSKINGQWTYYQYSPVEA